MRPIDSIDKCTTCSACVADCPVTAAARRFNGPKLTGPSSERFRLFSKAEIEALDYCSNCKNCDMACPSGVRISTLNMLARAHYCRQHKPPLRDWVLAHGHLLARPASLVPGMLLRPAMTNPLTRLILHTLGIDRRAPMPVFAPRSFTALFRRLPLKPSAKKVVFFPGCYINDYDPQTGLDVTRLLQRAGYEVMTPDFMCCGVPLIANGFYDEAEKNARRNSAELAHWARMGVPVIAACPSCALMLKEEYGELFPDVPDTGVFAPHIHDACEFVRGLLENGELQVNFRESADRLIYHAPCHLRAQGMGRPGLELLRDIGIRVEDAAAGCCGISGSYGFKTGKYEVASAVGAELFRTVRDSGAACVVTECGTCRLQISHHTGVRSLHPLSRLSALIL